jgi:hypothetical protein
MVTPEKEIKAAQTPSRLPFKVNQPDAIPARPLPTMTIKTTPGAQAPTVQTESPWKTFTAFRTLERGGEVIAACTQKVPIRMVAIKKLSSDCVKELAKFQHENLLSILGLYRFGGEFFVITDYTAATLKQIIAIPLPLEELHISATCRQGSAQSCSASHPANISKVFKGMQHLSRFGVAHKKLDSSKVLFISDGCVKIGRSSQVAPGHQLTGSAQAYFDECQSTESAAARSIGVIAVEMMQNGIPPESDGKFALKHPERWSAEASNFLEVASWGTLKDIDKVRDLPAKFPRSMRN